MPVGHAGTNKQDQDWLRGISQELALVPYVNTSLSTSELGTPCSHPLSQSLSYIHQNRDMVIHQFDEYLFDNAS